MVLNGFYITKIDNNFIIIVKDMLGFKRKVQISAYKKRDVPAERLYKNLIL